MLDILSCKQCSADDSHIFEQHDFASLAVFNTGLRRLWRQRVDRRHTLGFLGVTSSNQTHSKGKLERSVYIYCFCFIGLKGHDQNRVAGVAWAPVIFA